MKNKIDIGVLLLDVINREKIDSTYYSIAKTILKNINNVGNVKINDLAKLCCVSNATISRFCKYIGIDDYSIFRYELAKYELNPNKSISFTGSDNNSTFDIDDFLNQTANNVLRIKHTYNETVIEEIAKEIIKKENVVFVGYLQSGNAAYNLQTHLSSLGIIASVVSNSKKLKDSIKRIDKNSYILIFSKSGKTASDILEYFQLNNISYDKVGLVTSNKDLNLHSHIDHLLNLKIENDMTTEGISLNIVSNIIALKCLELKTETEEA